MPFGFASLGDGIILTIYTKKTTFLNLFDATLLSAVKSGVFVAQAAGNEGPM